MLENREQLRQLLASRLKQAEISASEQQLDQLMSYLALLVKWNKAYNLTAVRDPQEMVDRHLVDSLSVLPWIKETPLIDVGSGAGLPGIPLAIMKPELSVTTLDSNSKKTRFQQQVKAELKLDNLHVVHSRVESVDLPKFEQIISRAFASIEDMLHWTGHLCAEQGVFLAMKGLYPESELAQLPQGYHLLSSHQLKVPATEGARHLLILGRA